MSQGWNLTKGQLQVSFAATLCGSRYIWETLESFGMLTGTERRRPRLCLFGSSCASAWSLSLRLSALRQAICQSLDLFGTCLFVRRAPAYPSGDSTEFSTWEQQRALTIMHYNLGILWRSDIYKIVRSMLYSSCAAVVFRLERASW